MQIIKAKTRPKRPDWAGLSLLRRVSHSRVLADDQQATERGYTLNPNQWRCGKTNGGCGEQLPAKIRDVSSAFISPSECWLALSFEFFWSSHAHISPGLSFHIYHSYVHLLHHSFWLSSGCFCLSLFWPLSSISYHFEVPPVCHFTVGPPKCPSVLPSSYPLPPLSTLAVVKTDFELQTVHHNSVITRDATL